jgi:hypothetical protein
MAKDYRNIGDLIANTGISHQAIEFYSKGLEIFKEIEENTGYHHPLSDTIRGYISQLQ